MNNDFNIIYEQGLWGELFSSGPGSHWPSLVNAYVDCVKNFLKEESDIKSNTIIDIGCGDFNVGKNFLEHCNQYIGIDVSSKIIDRNRLKYKSKKLTFMQLDACTQRIPKGNILFLRQVLQHLDNQSISSLLFNLSLSPYEWLIVTEHIPNKPYLANLEHIGKSHQTRLDIGSGVAIDAEPFSYRYSEKINLLSYYGFGGIIQTVAYKHTNKAL